MSLRTVRGHMQDAMTRLDARTRAAAVVAAIRAGAVTVDGVAGTTLGARGHEGRAE